MRFIKLCVLVLAFSLPLHLMADTSVGCDDNFVSLSDKNQVVVKPTQADDTTNIQCALEAATVQGVPFVSLVAGTYSVGGVFIANFRGSLDGRTSSSTFIQVINNSIDCAAMEEDGFESAAFVFSGGNPRIRFMTIEAETPCTNGDRLGSILHFTGESAFADNCSNDVIFGAVDRVELYGVDLSANNGPRTGVKVSAQGDFFDTCKNTLLGRFKLNRSYISDLAIGIHSAMKAGAQVDVNFNFFVNNEVAVNFFNSNQNATITRNNFSGTSNDNYNYFGVNVVSFDDGPSTTRVVVNKNTFEIDTTDLSFAYAISLASLAPNKSISAVITNNAFRLSGDGSAIGVWGEDVSDTHVSANIWEGVSWRPITVVGDRPVTGWTITSNPSLATIASESGSQVFFGEQTNGGIIGPGQVWSVVDLGVGNFTLGVVNQPSFMSDASQPVRNTKSARGAYAAQNNRLRSLLFD